MHQATVPPRRKCSIPQASRPGAKRETVRVISLEEQTALEQAPFFDAFCEMLDRWARLATQEQTQGGRKQQLLKGLT